MWYTDQDTMLEQRTAHLLTDLIYSFSSSSFYCCNLTLQKREREIHMILFNSWENDICDCEYATEERILQEQECSFLLVLVK